MNCRELVALLDADPGALPPAALAHVAACPACAAALARAESVRRELRAMGEEPAPPFLAERVLARARTERQAAAPPARRSWLLGPAPALTVAALLAGIALALLLRGTPEPLREARSESARDVATPALPAARPVDASKGAATVPSEPVQPASPAAALAKDEAPAARRRPVAEPAAREKAPRPAPVEEREAQATTGTMGAAIAADAAATSERDAVAPRAVGGVAAPWGANETRERAAAPAEVAVAAAPAPAPAPEQVSATAGAPVLARQELGAASTPAGARGGLAASAAGADAVVAVTVAPAPADGRPARSVILREGDAPPAGTAWTVEAAPERPLVLRDAAGSDISGSHAGTLAALRAAALPPGRWRLSRP